MAASQKKRILLLIPNLTFGGAQRVFHEQANLLSTHYEVFECVYNRNPPPAYTSNNKLLDLNVRGGANWIDKIFRFIQRVKRVRRIKEQLKIDVCISHLEGADLVNVMSRKKERVITWVHGSKRFDQNIAGAIGWIRHRFLIPYTYSHADLVVTVSNAIKKELVDHYRVRTLTTQAVYNYFDVPDIRSKSILPLSVELMKIFEMEPVLVFSGRLAKQKNPLTMLKWFASFRTTNSAKLLIVGDGELRDEMLVQCDLLQLRVYHPWADSKLTADYHVYFVGFQENPFQFVSHASVFILPSMWEGFPMALGEAMACGVAVAAADCPTGPKEMLTDQTEVHDLPFFAESGLLLPLLTNETMHLWSAGIGSLLTDRSRLNYYRTQSTQRIEQFSKVKNAEKIFELINSLPGT